MSPPPPFIAYCILAFVAGATIFYIATFVAILYQLWYYGGQVEAIRGRDYKREYIVKPKRSVRDRSSSHSTQASTAPLVTTASRLGSSEGVVRRFTLGGIREFEDDDCGDGNEYPDIEVNVGNEPYPQREFREEPGCYMTMGIRKLDFDNWLTIERGYLEWFEAKAWILENRRWQALRLHDEAYEAAVELLQEVVHFLTLKYPREFEVKWREGIQTVRNCITSEVFPLEQPFGGWNPLEICARLAMEDFNILIKSHLFGTHYLSGSVTCAPAGLDLDKHFMKPIDELRRDVPTWGEKLADHVEHYLKRMDTKSCMERSSFFVQVKPDDRALHSVLFIREAKDLFPGTVCLPLPDTVNRADICDALKNANLLSEFIVIRRERQTFRRFPKSKAIVFAVHTSLQPLVEVPNDQLRGLAAEIRSWPDDIAVFKGRPLWGRTVLGYCEKKRQVIEDQDLNSDAGAWSRLGE